MTDTTVIHLALLMLGVIAEVGGPFLVVSLVIGLVVSLIQAVTSVQEFTLSFLPKVVGVAAVLLLAGAWMLGQLVSFTDSLFALIPHLLSGT